MGRKQKWNENEEAKWMERDGCLWPDLELRHDKRRRTTRAEERRERKRVWDMDEFLRCVPKFVSINCEDGDVEHPLRMVT